MNLKAMDLKKMVSALAPLREGATGDEREVPGEGLADARAETPSFGPNSSPRAGLFSRDPPGGPCVTSPQAVGTDFCAFRRK